MWVMPVGVVVAIIGILNLPSWSPSEEERETI